MSLPRDGSPYGPLLSALHLIDHCALALRLHSPLRHGRKRWAVRDRDRARESRRQTSTDSYPHARSPRPRDCDPDSGSQKLHHFSEKCLTSHLHSSVSRGFRTKNSSAIDRAAAARSESDEFFVLNPLVIEQGLIQCLKPPKRCCNFWDPESNLPVTTVSYQW